MPKLTQEELIAVRTAFRDAFVLRHAVSQAFEKMGITLTPLTLMVAAVQEFHEVCEGHGDLSATKEAFAEQCGAMASVAGAVQYTLAQMLASSASSDDAFSEIPAGAFVVPGPSEPQ